MMKRVAVLHEAHRDFLRTFFNTRWIIYTVSYTRTKLQNSMTTNATKPEFAFFGTGPIAVLVLDELSRAGYVPDIVVTLPDRPQGRGLAIAPSPVGAWAFARSIETIKPARIDAETIDVLKSREYNL